MSVKTAAGSPGAAPTSHAALRTLRLETALMALISRGPLSRTQLAEATGYSRPSITATVRDLIESGYVLDSGVQEATRGRHRTLLELNRSLLRFTLVSLEGDQFTLRQCDLAGNTTREAVQSHNGGDALPALTEALEALHSELDVPSRCVVLSLPGVVSSEGTVSLAPSLGRRGALRVRDELSARITLPVVVENDVNLLALGESRAGVAQTHQDFTLIYVSEGIGSALVIGGRPHRGASGSAGEIGFLPWGPALDRGTDVGPFEGRWSISALCQHAHALGVDGNGAEILPALDSSSDPAAWMLLRDAVDAWAYAGIVSACVVNPSLIVFGGASCALPDWAREALIGRVREGAPAALEVAFSSLSDAAITQGAIALLEMEPDLLLRAIQDQTPKLHSSNPGATAGPTASLD